MSRYTRFVAYGLGHRGLRSRTFERRDKRSFRRWRRRRERRECRAELATDRNGLG